jgi:hypothetical protein
MKRAVEMPALGTSKKRLPPEPWTTLRVAHIPTAPTAEIGLRLFSEGEAEKHPG